MTFTVKYIFLALTIITFDSTTFAYEIQKFQAGPDQVLVLYNADWEKDVDGSVHGQDSKEVAQYYVKRHTDQVTGKKPFILGLTCRHKQKHLNAWVIRENSQDNRDGIEFIGKGRGPGKGEWARDSRKIEITIKPHKETIDWGTVTFWCVSTSGTKSMVTDIEVTGIPKRKGRKITYPSVEEGKGRCYRFDAHKYARGTIRVLVEARDTSGKKIKTLDLRYFDRDDFKTSKTGADGISDEKHFQEDIAGPVRAFLEDPANRLDDGTLLKDHILYIVVCHGLPYSCEGVFGIERGVTPRPGDHGDLGSLEQRLQTLYYGWEYQIQPPVISMYMSGGPDSKEGIQNFRITSAMRYPMAGNRWQPYMHPDTYSFLGSKKDPRFFKLKPFPQVRKRITPALFAYGVSRIDGQGPREAKRLVDYSLYASKFMNPEMDSQFREPMRQGSKERIENLDARLAMAEKDNAWGKKELQTLGFTPIAKQNQEGIPFLKSDIRKSAANAGNNPYAMDDGWGTIYYPGAMDRTVVSGNGWNMGRSAPIWDYIDQGVTVSACGGPAYGGGPHITNATFWDNRILIRYLFRGRDLGECFLLSTFYVNWSTSLVGDPLYHPDLSQTAVDEQPPRATKKENIKAELFQAMGNYCGTITVPVSSNSENPELAMLCLDYHKVGQDAYKTSFYPFYSTQPYVVLRDLEPDAVYQYIPVLIDPYGNRTDLSKTFGSLEFKTGPAHQCKILTRSAKERGIDWKINLVKMNGIKENGTLAVGFEAGKGGCLPSIEADAFHLRSRIRTDGRLRLMLKIGGPERTWMVQSPIKEGEKVFIVIRWRRFPLTREVILKANNGTEFTLAADVRTPWEAMNPGGSIDIIATNGVKVISGKLFDDAKAASQTACLVQVPPINESEWRNAQMVAR